MGTQPSRVVVAPAGATDNRNRLWISLAGNNYVQPVSLKVKAGSDNRGLLPASDSSQRIGDRNADARSDIARKIVEARAFGALLSHAVGLDRQTC
jgi:hypothetical protein